LVKKGLYGVGGLVLNGFVLNYSGLAAFFKRTFYDEVAYLCFGGGLWVCWDGV